MIEKDIVFEACWYPHEKCWAIGRKEGLPLADRIALVKEGAKRCTLSHEWLNGLCEHASARRGFFTFDAQGMIRSRITQLLLTDLNPISTRRSTKNLRVFNSLCALNTQLDLMRWFEQWRDLSEKGFLWFQDKVNNFLKDLGLPKTNMLFVLVQKLLKKLREEVLTTKDKGVSRTQTQKDEFESCILAAQDLIWKSMETVWNDVKTRIAA